MLLARLAATLLALAVAAPHPPPASAPGVRTTGTAFGQAVEIEIRGLYPESAQAAAQAALQEMAAMDDLTNPEHAGGGVALLNAQAGKGPQPVDPRLFAVLTRALDFCIWTEGAHGPMARDLYALWGLRKPVAAPPAPDKVQEAQEKTVCQRLRLDAKTGKAETAVGSGIDLWGFAEGAAVDRAIEVLKKRGVRTAYVQLGGVRRGIGGGPDGKGWWVSLPQLPGSRVALHDRAMALVSPRDHPLSIRGEEVSPFLNQRTGLPSEGVVATAAVTDLAVDAEALAVTMTIIGPREGQLRLGSLKPKPSVLWMLPGGSGTPLVIEYRWEELTHHR